MTKSDPMENFNSPLPFKIFLSRVTHFDLHWHNYLEIFYVKKGNIRLTTGDFSFHLDEGHICFVDSNIIHSVSQTDVSNEILVLQISTESSSPFHSLSTYKFNPETYLSDLSNGTLPLEALQKLLNDSYEESLLKAPGYQNIITSFINALIGIMIRRYYLLLKTDDDYVAESNLQRLSQIIDYLDAHYTEKISLHQLADDLHMNYYYLSHFFKDTAGVSFQDYLNNLRVDKSLPLLADRNMSITRIAYDIGFPNIKAYTKAFREKFGVLPSEYRRTLLPDAPAPALSPGDNDSLIHTYLSSAEPFFTSPRSIKDFLSISEEVNLYHEGKHTLLHNADIVSAPGEPEEIVPASVLHAEPEALFLSDRPALLAIKNALQIDQIQLYSGCADIPGCGKRLRQLAAEIGCSVTRSSAALPADPRRGLEEFSLLPAADRIAGYLKDSSHRNVLSLCALPDAGLVEPFLGSTTLMTSFSVPTPALFAAGFLQQLSGSIVYRSDSCLVTQQGESYHIICCHTKSLDTYRALNEDGSFRLENYMFFTGSFPSMKFTFSFKNVKRRMKQTTLQVTNDHGCILTNWLSLGSPDLLSLECSDYLRSVTRPSLNLKMSPFRETPLITTELPPLGFACITLEPV